MELQLKKQILEKIEEIYPKFKKDAVILFGSRSLRFEQTNSDIDVIIFTNNTKYYQDISIKKGLRKKAEDVGFELPLNNNLHLEVKIHDYSLPKLNIIWINDVLNSQELIKNKDFTKYKEKISKQFLKDYNKILMKSYIHFYNELKTIEGMSKRQDELSKVNLFINKGITLQAFLRLILIMQGKPYPIDKWLYHLASKTNYCPKLKEFVDEFQKIENYEQIDSWKKKVRNFIDPKMPNKPYVANWWKFLKEFKEINY